MITDQVVKRLEIEYNNVISAIDEGVIENMTVDVEMKNGQRNYKIWLVTIYGREGTLWEGGEFPGILEFGADYPNSPPRYRWKLYGNLKFFHMNIFDSGSTCIDILNDKIGYTPARTAVEILKAMEEFLY